MVHHLTVPQTVEVRERCCFLPREPDDRWTGLLDIPGEVPCDMGMGVREVRDWSLVKKNAYWILVRENGEVLNKRNHMVCEFCNSC